MKAYVLTTGIVFVLVLAAHIARIASEGSHLMTEPNFAFTSTLSIALSFWAWRLFRRLSRPNE